MRENKRASMGSYDRIPRPDIGPSDYLLFGSLHNSFNNVKLTSKVGLWKSLSSIFYPESPEVLRWWYNSFTKKIAKNLLINKAHILFNKDHLRQMCLNFGDKKHHWLLPYFFKNTINFILSIITNLILMWINLSYC